MTDKFQNKYRIASARLQTWDYRWAGSYFITICTHNRFPFLGEIENGTMHLSRQGILADVFWHEIKNHTKKVELGAFVVMPNHIHGILILDGSTGMEGDAGDTGEGIINPGRPAHSNPIPNPNAGSGIHPHPETVETRHALSLRNEPNEPNKPNAQNTPPSSQTPPQPGTSKSAEPNAKPAPPPKTIGQQRFQNQGKNSVSSIIGSYKSAVTRHAGRLGLAFGWQTRFHEHIIRNATEYQRIENYIANNPACWTEDKFYRL